MYGLFFLNFLDAVSEGDGFRLITQWKYTMLYCRDDGHHSGKYALECLYKAFCVNALLSPRDCERFIWNRSVNNKGGRGKKIPLDLEVEHSNLFNIAAIRNLWANVTEKAVQRISFSEGGTANMRASVAESLNRLIGSGRQTSSSTERDLGELIKRAVLTQVFTEVPNRQYQHFKGFERDPFKNLNMSALFYWINQHKKNVLRGNKARWGTLYYSCFVCIEHCSAFFTWLYKKVVLIFGLCFYNSVSAVRVVPYLLMALVFQGEI